MKKILYATVILFAFQSCGDSRTTVRKFEGKIERDQISVTTKVPGRVQQIFVSKGQHVQKGDTLLVLELPEVEAKSLQARGALEAAQAQYDMALKGATDGQLRQLNAKVDGLREQYEFAEKSLKRMESLLEDSLVSTQQYDEVYAKTQGAKNQYLAAQAELAEVKEGARVEQQKMALGQKERALGALDEVGAAQAERFILAPQDMSVETINLQIGELALAGYSIVSGYLDQAVYFRVTVPESALGDFEKESRKTLVFPFLNDREVIAQVESVKALTSYASISTAYPDFEEQETVFEVRLTPEDRKQIVDLPTKASFLVKPSNQ